MLMVSFVRGETTIARLAIKKDVYKQCHVLLDLVTPTDSDIITLSVAFNA